jgi:RNA polymerase sigma factor (sigma-70 family)
MTAQKFGAAYQKGFQRTVRFLQKRGVGQDQAAEIAQAAWTKGWERISQLRNEQLVIEWVNTGARHQLLTSFRQPRLVDLSEMSYEPAIAPSVAPAAIDVRRALDEIKPRQRKLLTEVYWDGYSISEVARNSGKSVGAVRAALKRARHALKRWMQGATRPVLASDCVSRKKAQREVSS